MVRRYRDVCIQKEQHFEFISSSGKCPDPLVSFILPDVTTSIPNLVNYRISCLQIDHVQDNRHVGFDIIMQITTLSARGQTLK